MLRLCANLQRIYTQSNCREIHLLLNKSFVNNKWIESKNNDNFNVYNPANGAIVGTVPNMDVKDAENAIEVAHSAFHSNEWKNFTAKDRSAMLKRWFTLLQEHRNEIAEIMTAESGKPLAESIGEVNYGNSFVEWFGEEARRIYGEIVPSPQANRQIFLLRQPIGVAGLITPWNFPHAMITRKAAAAIAAGCTVVIKPAEDTPLTALALAKLAQEAGFPKGVLNIVTSSRKSAAAIGKLFCQSPLIAGISFTGSTEVGKLLYAQCASGIKRIGLELGGNAPFIVFPSADIDQAVLGAMAAKFRNCGQTCVSANRFLIHEDVYDEFVQKITEKVKKLIVGNGKDDNVNVGPLINEAQVHKVGGLVEDARSKGAQICVGGKPLSSLGQLFYEPTIISGISKNMRIYTEEVFGPIITIIKFKNEEEAMKIANDTRRGLAGYFYSQDISQVFRVARDLEVGMIGCNEGIISTAEAAFGGIKESGVGREGSKHGIDDYVYIKYLCLGNLQ